MLIIIPQPDRMLTELKKVNEADSCLLHQWTFWSMVIIIKFQILCFHCWGACPRYKIQQLSLLHWLLQLTLIPEATITCRLVIPLLYAAFRQSVPS